MCVRVRGLAVWCGCELAWGEQLTAIFRAVHTCRIRSSLSLPSRWVSVAIETLSIESRFNADLRGIGSSTGSRTTSLGRPRMLVVHGAITTRRSLGIAMSRDKTTTGRREISANSHHQISPRDGSPFTTTQLPHGRTPGPPTRPGGQGAGRRRPRMPHLSPLLCDLPAAPSTLHQAASRRSRRIEGLSLRRGVFRPLWCSLLFLACHNHATTTPQSQWCSTTHSLSCRSRHGECPRTRTARCRSAELARVRVIAHILRDAGTPVEL